MLAYEFEFLPKLIIYDNAVLIKNVSIKSERYEGKFTKQRCWLAVCPLYAKYLLSTKDIKEWWTRVCDMIPWRGRQSIWISSFHPKVFIHVSISWHIIPNIPLSHRLRQPHKNDTTRFIRFIVLLFRVDFFLPLLAYTSSLQLLWFLFSFHLHHDSFLLQG